MRSAKHGRRAPFCVQTGACSGGTKARSGGARRFAHFSQAVLVEVPGPTLYVAGQGDVTGDFEIQARKAWTQIEVLLNEAGMTLTDVVKVTGYVVDRNYVSAYRAVFLEVMGEVRPASTLVICDLVHPAMLVEIEIVATKN